MSSQRIPGLSIEKFRVDMIQTPDGSVNYVIPPSIFNPHAITSEQARNLQVLFSVAPQNLNLLRFMLERPYLIATMREDYHKVLNGGPETEYSSAYRDILHHVNSQPEFRCTWSADRIKTIEDVKAFFRDFFREYGISFENSPVPNFWKTNGSYLMTPETEGEYELILQKIEFICSTVGVRPADISEGVLTNNQ